MSKFVSFFVVLFVSLSMVYCNNKGTRFRDKKPKITISLNKGEKFLNFSWQDDYTLWVAVIDSLGRVKIKPVVCKNPMGEVNSFNSDSADVYQYIIKSK